MDAGLTLSVFYLEEICLKKGCISILLAKSCLTTCSYCQAQLLDSLYGLERGLNASGEIKGEISELILKLEACNPTPEPNKVLCSVIIKVQLAHMPLWYTEGLN